MERPGRKSTGRHRRSVGVNTCDVRKNSTFVGRMVAEVRGSDLHCVRSDSCQDGWVCMLGRRRGNGFDPLSAALQSTSNPFPWSLVLHAPWFHHQTFETVFLTRSLLWREDIGCLVVR